MFFFNFLFNIFVRATDSAVKMVALEMIRDLLFKYLLISPEAHLQLYHCLRLSVNVILFSQNSTNFSKNLPVVMWYAIT